MRISPFHSAPCEGGRRAIALILVGLLLATGCLPHGCQRQTSDALFPADSLSRRIAQQVPVDTLRNAWQTSGTPAHPLAHPRTVRFLGSDRVVVSDAERNSLFVFGTDGTFEQEIAPGAFDVPYLAGTRGDTAVVFSAGTDRIDFVVGGRIVQDRSIRIERPEEALAYTLATDTSLYAKYVAEEHGGFVGRLDRAGRFTARVRLPGPYWRHAGFLRAWGDSLLSLSGFRPVVDVLPWDFARGAARDTVAVDTMALRGFDSPMLERSYAFAQGEVSQPPLLTGAADAAGPLLFVLNMRPARLQVDVYDHAGRLQRRLRQAQKADSDVFPQDLAARRTPQGYEIAVVLTSPEPRLAFYRWTPPEGATLASD